MFWRERGLFVVASSSSLSLIPYLCLWALYAWLAGQKLSVLMEQEEVEQQRAAGLGGAGLGSAGAAALEEEVGEVNNTNRVLYEQ